MCVSGVEHMFVVWYMCICVCELGDDVVTCVYVRELGDDVVLLCELGDDVVLHVYMCLLFR